MSEHRSSDLTVLVLAAGLGTRYGRLKQIDPIGPGSSALIDYALADARRAGCLRAVVVVRAEIEDEVAAHLAGSVGDRLPITLVRQRPDDLPGALQPRSTERGPLGTAHALWSARTCIDGPFIVVNADDYYGPEAYRLLAGHLGAAKAGDWAMVGYRLRETLPPEGGVSRGLCTVGSDRRLVEIREALGVHLIDDAVRGVSAGGQPLDLSGDEVASMNIWGFTPDVMPRLGAWMEGRGQHAGKGREFFLPDAVGAAIQARHASVKVFMTDETTFGLTHAADRDRAAASLLERGAPWPA